jgi:hypothetical protein
MPTTSPSAFSGCRSRENFLPPPRLTLLNLPPRPRPAAEDILCVGVCVYGGEGGWEDGKGCLGSSRGSRVRERERVRLVLAEGGGQNLWLSFEFSTRWSTSALERPLHLPLG